MRYILKFHEPTEYKDWKALRNDDWEPSWDNLMNPEKKYFA